VHTFISIIKHFVIHTFKSYFVITPKQLNPVNVKTTSTLANLLLP